MSKPSQIEVAGRFFDRPLVVAEIYGVTYKIMRHPSLLIPAHITEWIKDYEYTKEYKIPTPYDDRHPCWLQLREEWESILTGLGYEQQ